MLLPLLAHAARNVMPQTAANPIPDEVALLQRWAIVPSNHHDVDLSDAQLNTYLATGTLPSHDLVQLQIARSMDSSVEAIPSPSDVKMNNTLRKMREDEQKLVNMRLMAEKAKVNVSAQEARLSKNFRNVSQKINGLIQKAVKDASRAEMKTMVERLKRIHYKQIATLDRSASYWIEDSTKQKEAARVAAAKKRLEERKRTQSDNSLKLAQMEQARAQEKAQLEQWSRDYWTALEQAEKEKMRKEAAAAEESKRAQRLKDKQDEQRIRASMPALPKLTPLVIPNTTAKAVQIPVEHMPVKTVPVTVKTAHSTSSISSVSQIWEPVNPGAIVP